MFVGKRLFPLTLVALVTVVIAGAVTSPVQATDLALTGYLENQLSGEDTEETTFLNYNRFNLSLHAKVAEQVFFETSFVFMAYQGKTVTTNRDAVPDKFADSPALLEETILEDEYYLDRAVASLLFDHGSLNIGKQSLLQGIGYAWNPSDLLNEKNPFDPAYEKEGINALQLEYSLFSKTALIVTYSPEDTWQESFRQFKVRHSFSFLTMNMAIAGLAFQPFDYKRKQPEPELLYSCGDVTVNSEFLSLWSEYMWNFDNTYGQPDRWITGFKLRPLDTLSIIGEYFRNNWGEADSGDYNLGDWIRSRDSYHFHLGQEYAMAAVHYEVFEDIQLVPVYLLNLSDSSSALSPAFSWMVTPRFQVELTLVFPFGDHSTEFGEDSFNGWFRIKLFF